MRLKKQTSVNTKESMENMINAYGEGFTIHGLSKIFAGVLLEKIFWFVILAACLGFFIHEGRSFFAEYKKYNVRTEVSIKTDSSITLPTVTVCRSLSIYGSEYMGFLNEIRCYKNQSLYTIVGSGDYCKERQ